MYNAVVHGMGRLLAAFYDFIPNYGIGIVMLTVLVRVAMIPLAVKQFHIMEANRANAEKMRKLLPEVKKIREKYRDDRAKQYEEQKRLYDQHGVNMLGGLSGCLPVLVQMPIFMAMYSVLSGCNKIFGSGRRCTEGFHIPNGSELKAVILEGRDTFLGMNLNLRPSGVLQDQGLVEALPYYLLVAVMGYTMWFQTRQMMKAQPVVDPQMAQTQKIMQFMPLLIVFASLSFPAGLTVYWSATNIWSIAQQTVFLRKLGPARSEREEKPAREKEPAARQGRVGSRLKAIIDEASQARSEAARTAKAPPAKGPSEAARSAKAPPAKPAPEPRPATTGKRAPAKASTGPRPASSGKAAAAKAASGSAGASAAAAHPTPETVGAPEESEPVAPAKTASAKTTPAAPKKRPAKGAAGSGGSTGAPKRAASGAGGKASGGSAAKKPAANRSRSGSAGATPKKAPAKGSGTKASSGGSSSTAGAGAGRPKGSGARKKSKGGHR